MHLTMEQNCIKLIVGVLGIIDVQSQLASPVLVRESETASFRWRLPAASGSFTAVYVISPAGAAVLQANIANYHQVVGNYTTRVTYTGNLTADPKVMAFDLRSVVRSDAGNYTCGKNGITDIIPQCGQKLVVLGQPTKPTVNGPSAPVFGRQVTLSCNSTSTTVPADHGLTLTYTWQRDNAGITVTSPGSPYAFTVNSRDSHSYRCRARETQGLESEWSQLYNMEPQYGPYAVTVQPSTLSYTRREGQESVPSILCSATCKPACIYKWFKDGTPHSDGATLTLPVADRSQTGSYKCQASNTHGTVDSSSVSVDVTYVPEVTLSPTCQPHRVYVGQPNAQLICQVTAANPSVTSYIWTHNGSPISSATSREYSLSPVSRSSGGSYTCAGRNSVGTSSVSAVTVEVQYKPSVSVPQSIPVRESQTLNISCSVDANPAAAVTWTKKDDSSFTSQSGSTLTISNIQRSQAGTYVCTATNTLSPCVGTALPQSESREMTVDVQYVPEVTLSPTCQPHRVYVGQPNAQLICQVTAANPSVTSYIWTHNGSPISSATSREYSLSPVSRSSGGSYTCAGRNSVGTSSVSAVTVEVQYKPSVSVPQSTPVRESQTLNISCSVDANPAAAVTWTKKDDSSFTSQSGSTLTISNIQRSQARTYVCTATNTLSPCVGTALPQSESREMTVDVQYSANITSFSINSKQNRVTVNERDPVTITCQVDGNPRSSIILYNGSVEISRADNSESDQKGWPHAECRQRGNYSCTADNNIGSGEQRRVVELLIHCSPRYDESYPVQDRYASATNSDVSLSVHILSYPGPNITWSRTNITTQRNLTSSTSLTRISDLTMMSTLTLTNVQRDDFGEYHVYVNNGVGQPVEYSITLDPKGPPGPPTNVTVIPLGPSSLQVSWIKGFNGGDTQTFIVEYSTDDASWKEAGKYVENGLEEYQTNITGLQPQTVFYVRVTAENVNGRSFGTNSVRGLTGKEVKVTGGLTSPQGGLIAGVTVGMLVLAVIVVVVVIMHRKGFRCVLLKPGSKVLQNRPKGHATQREHVEAGDVNLYSGLQDRENDKQTYTYLKTYENAGVAASTGTDSTNEYEGLERKDQQHYEAIKLAMYGNTGKDATYMNT
ncbi:B-cell receptor CD22-like [Haliotis asinina]|uniref:B-cell receptor CD22-like n=1 Tax=Haliotis asinina TaxID=109174 RepID=UPI003531F4DA